MFIVADLVSLKLMGKNIYNLTLKKRCLSKPVFIYNENSKGPRKVSCGTPDETGTQSDFTAFYCNILKCGGQIMLKNL